MNLDPITYPIANFFKQHGSTILAFVACFGVAGTAYLSGRAAIKANEKLKENPEADIKEKIKIVAPIYAAPTAVGIATASCIICANVLDKKRQGSLVAAGAIVEETFRKYKRKAEELLGKNVVDLENAKDDISKSETDLSKCERLFYYDRYVDLGHLENGSYFESTPEKVLSSEYELNRMFVIRGRVTLNDWFELLGLNKVEGGDDIGWSKELGDSFYGYSWVDFEHYDTEMDDGLECTIISTPFEPCPLA